MSKSHIGLLASLRNMDDAQIVTESALMDEAYESVLEHALDLALEATNDDKGGTRPKGHIIEKSVRDSLPDSAFGIPSARKYPLIVKGDKKVTAELIARAIQFFHFAKPDWKEELAKNIIKAIDESGVQVKIHPKSQIHKYVDVPNDLVKADIPDKYRQPK